MFFVDSSGDNDVCTQCSLNCATCDSYNNCLTCNSGETMTLTHEDDSTTDVCV